MKQHSNATLTVAQRKKVKWCFDNESLSKSELARQFGVHRRTIAKWVERNSPLDKTSETRKKQVVTPEYEQAVIEYRKANPTLGAIPIALALQKKSFRQSRDGSFDFETSRFDQEKSIASQNKMENSSRQPSTTRRYSTTDCHQR